MEDTCNHDPFIRHLRTRCFMGPVAGREENPAAHGCVTITQECAGCGRRRDINVNGVHEERGAWGPSRAQRQQSAREADRVVRELIAARPSPVTLYRGRERADVAIDEDGYLIVSGAQPTGEEIYAATPDLVDYAVQLRLAEQEAHRRRLAD